MVELRALASVFRHFVLDDDRIRTATKSCNILIFAGVFDWARACNAAGDVVSIPSAVPVTNVPLKAPPPQPAANSVAASFADLLKLLGTAEPPAPPAPPQLLTGGKDKSVKEPKKEEEPKKKLATLTPDLTAVPVPVPTTSPDVKPLRFAWPSSQSIPQDKSKEDPTVHDPVKPDNVALKDGLTQARTRAPVTFGVNLANANSPKPEAPKESRTSPKPVTAPDTGKGAVEAIKPTESKSASARDPKQQQHSGLSQDDQPADPATGAHSIKTVVPGIVSTVSTNQTPSPPAAVVQSAYAPAPMVTASNKVEPTAAVSTITEPAAPTTVARPQNIDLKIGGGPDSSAIDVRVSQRAGDVQVTVRTPDGDLAQSLRQHLPELSDRLSQNGVAGSVWQPQTAQAANTGANDSGARYSDDAQTQQQQSQQQQSRGNSHQGSQQQQQQEEQQTQRPVWLGELHQAERQSN